MKLTEESLSLLNYIFSRIWKYGLCIIVTAIFMCKCNPENPVVIEQKTKQSTFDSLNTIIKLSLKIAEQHKLNAKLETKRADSIELEKNKLQQRINNIKIQNKPKLLASKDTSLIKAYIQLASSCDSLNNVNDSLTHSLKDEISELKSAINSQDTAIHAETKVVDLMKKDEKIDQEEIKKIKKDRLRKTIKIIGETIAAVFIVEVSVLTYLKFK